MTDAPLLTFAGVALIAAFVVLAIILRAYQLRIADLEDRFDRALEVQADLIEMLPEKLRERLAHVERELKITAATDRHLKAQALHRGEGSVQ